MCLEVSDSTDNIKLSAVLLNYFPNHTKGIKGARFLQQLPLTRFYYYMTMPQCVGMLCSSVSASKNSTSKSVLTDDIVVMYCIIINAMLQYIYIAKSTFLGCLASSKI